MSEPHIHIQKIRNVYNTASQQKGVPLYDSLLLDRNVLGFIITKLNNMKVASVPEKPHPTSGLKPCYVLFVSLEVAFQSI